MEIFNYWNASLASVLLIIYGIYCLNIPSIVIKKIQLCVKKWNSLRSLSRVNGNSEIKSFLTSCKWLGTALCINISQKMNLSVLKLKDDTYEISYVLEGVDYKLLVTQIKGPALVEYVEDENQNDITDKIIPYLGPKNDWHNQVYNPSLLGHCKLTFYLSNGEEISFTDDETIELTKVETIEFD